MKRGLLAGLYLLALLAGCHAAPPEPTSTPTPVVTPTPAPVLAPEQYEALFQQELLFLQQGLRQHDVQGEFTVYFGQPDAEFNERYRVYVPDGTRGHELLLCGDDCAFPELLSYGYDKRKTGTRSAAFTNPPWSNTTGPLIFWKNGPTFRTTQFTTPSSPPIRT